FVFSLLWRRSNDRERVSLEARGAVCLYGPRMRLATSLRAIDWPSFSSGRSRSPARLAVGMGKLLLSGGLIGYLLYHYGPGYSRLGSIDPVLCMMGVAVFVLQIALNTIRWRLILT